jgi:hypothetical protein
VQVPPPPFLVEGPAVKRTVLGARKRPVNAAGLEHRRPAVAYPHPRAAIRPQATAGQSPFAAVRARDGNQAEAAAVSEAATTAATATGPP